MEPRPDIVISGMGAACGAGTGCSALWDALASGRDTLRPVRRFAVEEFATTVAALWPAWQERKPPDCTAFELASASAREAWTAAGMPSSTVDPRRSALVLGTCFGEDLDGFSGLSVRLAGALGIEGPSLTIPTACTSSTAAIGLGRDLLEEGTADVVLAGGVDVLTREIFAGFNAIGALSSGKCAPFGASPGMSLGEGSGFVVLEREEDARRRGREPLGHLLGYGLSADAFHETSPDPSGSGVIRAIRAALADAMIEPADVDFVSAHGTGTELNDAAEWIALRTVFGDRIPVSSTKSFLGHAQGAAGVLELAALILCFRRGLVPPTLRARPPRPGAPPDPVAEGHPRRCRVSHALKVSAAFGGSNAALLVGPHPVIRSPAGRRAIHVTGLAALTPAGLGLAELESCWAARRRLVGRVPAFPLQRLVRAAPARDLDPSGQLVTAAAAIALADAKVVVRGARRDRCGVFTGNTRMSASSVDACRRSITQRGILGVASVPFSRMVHNAPAGTCAKLLSLRGPLLVVSAGRASGLLAIVRAAAILAHRRDADLLVAGGLDELAVNPASDDAEGAAFAVLSAEEGTGAPGLSGWGIAGGSELRMALVAALGASPEVDAIVLGTPLPAAALLEAGLDLGRPTLRVLELERVTSGMEAAASALAFVLACALVRRAEARRVLVCAVSSNVACAAVVEGGHRGS